MRWESIWFGVILVVVFWGLGLGFWWVCLAAFLYTGLARPSLAVGKAFNFSDEGISRSKLKITCMYAWE